MELGFIFSIGIILILGFVIGTLLNKIKIPGLVGMIIVGMLIGPSLLNLIDPSIMGTDEIEGLSGALRKIALVIILTRSGLNLDIKKLKEIGRPAFLMCFVPASFEILGVGLTGHFLLDLSWFEAFLLGCVLAAVSPAVVSPRMIKLIEGKYGAIHGAPELVLAGSSVDDIYVIVLFYAFLGLVKSNSFSATQLLKIPSSIITGILLGILVGFLLVLLFKHTKFNTTVRILIMLATSFMMVGLEDLSNGYLSGLLGIIVMAMIILFKLKQDSKPLSTGYNSMWTFFEIILFVLVGAQLNFTTVKDFLWQSFVVLFVGLAFRTVGVMLCLIKTKLTKKERIFVMISYLPKATVQASIGGIALAQGLPCGDVILAVAVISILVTAPIGAFLIDTFAKKLLDKEDNISDNSSDTLKLEEDGLEETANNSSLEPTEIQKEVQIEK